jgi:enoyl-[acyl-carrier protein] reductase I
MELLEGKTGLVFGVANERSYAWHISKSLVENGATCAFGCLPGEKNEARTRFAVEALGIEDPWIRPCEVSSDAEVDRVFAEYGASFRRLDFVIHSIAYADREWLAPNRFTETPREAFLQALDISTYSLIALARRAREQMASGGGGSILAMSYYGAEKVIPGYNVMGVAKSALECTARYLAHELGAFNIRVNTISGGPLKTVSAAAIGGFKDILSHTEKRSPLRRNVEGADVGNTAVWLVSDLSSGVTAENVYVDCGINTFGM